MTETTVAPSSVSAFKKVSTSPNTPIKLPSGLFMRIKRSSMQVFLASGVLPNNLMAVVQKSLDKGKGVDAKEFLGDPGKLDEMIQTIDNVVIFCALEPEVYPLPEVNNEGEELEERDQELLYVDEVSDEDKMFIFQYATGGTKDLDRFRGEVTAELARIQPGETVAVQTERPARPKPRRR